MIGRQERRQEDLFVAGPLRDLIRKSEVRRLLKKHGYTVIAFSSGVAAAEMTTADVFLTPGWFEGEFSNALLDMTPLWVLFQGLAPTVQHRRRLTYTFDRLARLSEQPSPKFVFAHVMSPHRPFVFGPKGEPVDPSHLNEPAKRWWDKPPSVADYRKFYVGQLRYVNVRLRNLIEAILTTSTHPPIIIIQGDHGPQSLGRPGQPSTGYLQERFPILNTYYLQGEQSGALYPEISPVNSFRVIFNHVFGTDYELLKDENLFTRLDKPYDVTNVTEDVRAGLRPGASEGVP